MRRAIRFAAIGAVGLATSVYAQAIRPEVEPNETKARATVVTLSPGDAVTGSSTGAATSGAAGATVDFFRIRTAGEAVGRIYRHRLVLTSTTPGHASAIYGLAQANGVILPTSSVMLQNSSPTTNPARFVQWYGFGLGEQIYFRVSGATVTTAPYFATLQSDVVTPTPIGPFQPGSITIQTTPAAGINSEIFLYDSSFQFLAMNDDVCAVTPVDRSSQLQLNLDPGVYYLGVARFNACNDQPSSGGLEFMNGNVLDFPNALVAEQIGTGAGLSFFVSDTAGPHPFAAIQSEPFQILWYRLDVVRPCDPALVATPPSSVDVCEGHPAAFQAVGGGTPPLSFQWRFNGNAINGENSDSLVIPAASFASAGLYDVVISNACGSATSAAAELFVHQAAPEITNQPDPQTLCIGQTAVFSVAAAGHMNNPLLFQWFKDDAPIAGAIEPQYSFQVAGLADGGQYACMVTEVDCGSATSLPALLTVRNDPPVISLIGAQAMTLECGVDHYSELGAVAQDDCDASVPVVVSGDAVNDRRCATYTVRYNATDSQGNPAIEVSRAVLVRDTIRPVVNAAVRDSLLWPPNHELVNVHLSARASDAGDPSGAASSLTLHIFSNEAEGPGCGDNGGRHAPDARNLLPDRLRLRAERFEQGHGRVYLIVVSAADGSGNVGFDFATVVCPLNHSPAAINAVRAMAVAARASAATAAQSAKEVEVIVRALKAQGWTEVGLAPACGPHQ